MYCDRLHYNRLESNDYEIDNRDGFNVSSIGTIEFRMKESVSSSDPIIRWIKLTQAVVESVADNIKNRQKKFKEKASLLMDAFDKEFAIQTKDSMDNNDIIDKIERYNNAKSYSIAVLGLK
jgi:hypothetical protein